MKKTMLAVLLAASVVSMPGFAGDTARKAIEAAKTAQEKADSLQGGWITTDELISKAEAALAEGDEQKALTLAKRAKREAELAYVQAERERKHWSPPPYLHLQPK